MGNNFHTRLRSNSLEDMKAAIENNESWNCCNCSEIIKEVSDENVCECGHHLICDNCNCPDQN